MFGQTTKPNLTKMKKLDIFDPALCCSTGVCGPSPDPQLIAFASVAKALEGKADIHRYNLSQEPTAFSDNAIVQKILQEDGTDALPVVLIDGKLAMKGVYPSREQLEQLLGSNTGEAECCSESDAKEGCCDSGDGDSECCSPDESASSSCC